MGYALLILGLLAWSGSHMWKRVAPDSRAAMGDQGRGIVALLSFAGIVLMVLGYRWAPYDPIWAESNALRHVNNLLMLVVFYLFAASGMKTAAARYIRHPQLWGVRLWAIAHLMVNGDLASLLLFGGLLVWAQVQVLLINRQEVWAPLGGKASTGKEIGAVVGAVLVMGVVGYIHGMIGPWPFS